MLFYYPRFNLTCRDLWFTTRFWIFKAEFFIMSLFTTNRKQKALELSIDLWHLICYLNTSITELCWTLCSFSLNWFSCTYKIKWRSAFTKHATQKSITQSKSTSMSWYYLHLVHLILNAKNVMRKTSGNVF